MRIATWNVHTLYRVGAVKCIGDKQILINAKLQIGKIKKK